MSPTALRISAKRKPRETIEIALHWKDAQVGQVDERRNRRHDLPGARQELIFCFAQSVGQISFVGVLLQTPPLLALIQPFLPFAETFENFPLLPPLFIHLTLPCT